MPQGFDKAKPVEGQEIDAVLLRTQFNANNSSNEGPTAPPDPLGTQNGMFWLDTGNASNWILKMRIEGDGGNPDRWNTLFENVNGLISLPSVPGGNTGYEEDFVSANPWVVTHNLGKDYPFVNVVNTGTTPPSRVDPSTYQVEYDSNVQVTITFDTGATSGRVIVI